MILSGVPSVWQRKSKGKKLNQWKTGVAFHLLSLHSMCLLSLFDCLSGTWLLNLISMLLLFPLSDTEKLELTAYWLTRSLTARQCIHPVVCPLVCARTWGSLGCYLQAVACSTCRHYTQKSCHLQQQSWDLNAKMALLLVCICATSAYSTHCVPYTQFVYTCVCEFIYVLYAFIAV